MRGDHVPSGDRREITRSRNFEARKPAVCHVVDLLRSHPRPWMEDRGPEARRMPRGRSSQIASATLDGGSFDLCRSFACQQRLRFRQCKGLEFVSVTFQVGGKG